MWLLGCCCSCLLHRVQCLDFWGDANSFSSVVHGVVEILRSCCEWPLQPLSVGLSTYCSPCHGQLQSALWSIKPKCFQGGEMKPSAFNACTALVWNVFTPACLHSPPEPHQDLCAAGTGHHTMLHQEHSSASTSISGDSHSSIWFGKQSFF